MTDRPIRDAYEESRTRVTKLVSAQDDAPGIDVPACPQWTVHDVVSHVTGVCADSISGNLDGVATDPWTDAQVRARRGRPTGDVLAEWGEVGPTFAGFLDDLDATGVQALTDLLTHEHDIRGAVGDTGGRDEPVIDRSVEFLVRYLIRPAVKEMGLPAVVVTDGATRWATTRDVPDDAVTLRGDRFELLRAMTGRRSERQIRALDWSGDPSAYLPAFGRGPFTVPVNDLVE